MLAIIIIVMVNFGLFLATQVDYPLSRNLIQTYMDSGGAVAALCHVLYMVFSFAQRVLEFLSTILIIRRNRHMITVFAVSVLLGLCSLVCSTLEGLSNPLLPTGATFVFIVIGILGGVLVLGVGVLFLLYFFRSVRLRTYMGSPSYITQGPWKFIKAPIPAVPDPFNPRASHYR